MSRDRLHVVTGDYAPRFTGGVASWTELVCVELAKRGLELELHARGVRALGRGTEAAHDGALSFPVHRIRTARWNQNQARAVAAHLVPSLRSGDRVLATTWPLATQLVEPCRSLGIPLVVVAHGSEVSRLTTPPSAELEGLASWARFAAVSEFLAGILDSIGVAATVLPSPVDLSFDPRHAREGLLVVARCTPLKGIDRALRLAEALGWPATVVGEGPELASLRQLARQLSVPVRFEGRLGWQDTMERCRRARLLAQLSRVDRDGSGAEGLGLVVLEAIAHGAPAVVSAVGGLPEAVGPGLVLDEPDDPEACATAVLRWLQGGDRIAEQRSWLASTHGMARTVDALLALCQDGV